MALYLIGIEDYLYAPLQLLLPLITDNTSFIPSQKSP
jgi:hypothetical protein